MIVYAIDQRFQRKNPPARHKPSDVVATTIMPNWDIPMVARCIENCVRGKGQGERSIWLLRICCHGDAGFLQFGQGVRIHNVSKFNLLARWMTPGGKGVVLDGCGAASDKSIVAYRNRWGVPITRPGVFRSDGPAYDFLAAMAREVKVPVTGGVNPQGMDKDFRMEGPTVTVFPSGRYKINRSPLSIDR